MDLTYLLAPKSIAVVGASERSGPGKHVLDNLDQMGYGGEVFPVNPKYRQVGARRCYESLIDIGREGKPVDMVAIVLGRDRIIPVLEEAAAIGVKAAWAFASGFAEAGKNGKMLQVKLEGFCRDNQIAFCGPNCVGFLNPAERASAYSAPVSPSLRAGNIGAVVQSGSVCLALANSNRGLGYSLLVSSGNEAVLDSTDYMSYMVEDENTEVVLAFIEQFRRPDRLREVARRAQQLNKPIVVLKVGRSQMAKQAAITHTGAMTGVDAVYDAVFKKYGIIRVNSLDEMLETAAALSAMRCNLPVGNKIGMITVSGGEIGLVGDLTEDLDVEFPDWSPDSVRLFKQALPGYSRISNPLDAWGSGKVEQTYPPTIAAAAADKGIDVVVISQDCPMEMARAQVDQYKSVANAAADIAKASDKPIVAISNLSGGLHPELRHIFEDGGVTLLQGTQEGLRAVSNVINYGRFSRTVDYTKVEKKEIFREAFLGHDKKLLLENEAKEFLSKYGIPCVKEVMCHSVEEVIDAFRKIGKPVAVKVISPELPHKTDADIVRLSICHEADLRLAYHQVMRNARRCVPEATITGVLVQKMITDAVAEVIVGISRDVDFGPIVLFGLGRSLGIPPLSREEAIEMVRLTKANRLLRGFRGSPVGDEESLVKVIGHLSEVALDWEDKIQALDINPLLVLPAGQGAVAVDALIQLRTECEDR